MNWLIYVGGFGVSLFLLLGIIFRLFGIEDESQIKDESLYSLVAFWVMVWIWICWKFIA